MRRSVSADDRYYHIDITQAQRDELHAWIDTFGDHRRTHTVTVVGEGTVETQEIDWAATNKDVGIVYRIHRYLTDDPPPWTRWES